MVFGSRPPRSVALLLLSAALSGCFGGKNPDARCNDVSEYQLSGSVPDVVAPDGLVTPSRESAYVVPPANPNGETALNSVGAACLARPPDYFRKEPLAAPAQ